MKRFITFTSCLLLSFSLFWFIKEKRFTITSTSDMWSTFQKKSQKIKQYATKKSEVALASWFKDEEKKEEKVDINERQVIGPHANNFLAKKYDLDFKNFVNPKWKEILGEELLRFQDEGTKVLVKAEKALLRVEKSVGLYMEQVLITYLLPSGEQSSFRALVDSSSGRIIRTWDRTIFESPSAKALNLTPNNI